MMTVSLLRLLLKYEHLTEVPEPTSNVVSFTPVTLAIPVVRARSSSLNVIDLDFDAVYAVRTHGR